MQASPERLEQAKTCGENIKHHCKKWSAVNGDITTPQGRKGCKSALKQAKVWGEDMSPTCQQDPEDARNCKHTGCAYSQNLTPGDYEGVINTHIDSLQSDPKPLTMRDRASSMASKFSWGRRSQGGKRKQKKTKKKKKSRKSRTLKKHKKSKKHRKH